MPKRCRPPSRAVRRPISGVPSAKLALLRSVVEDTRFAALNGRAGEVILVCLLIWSDGAGRFWPKSRTVAEFLKTNEKTVRRALDSSFEAGILDRERYQRPDGTLGTYTYSVSADICARAWPPATSGRSSGPVIGVQSSSEDATVRADQVLDPKNAYPSSADHQKNRLVIVETCMDCKRRGDVVDTGERLLCERCAQCELEKIMDHAEGAPRDRAVCFSQNDSFGTAA